ncbi:type II toxin-antitoxin system Phd/YefM family antitoxin [Photobacterium leiognathi]|uniref:type II toxin-antitoxin system Phd/YefM family antitoxin n=1 Tax=Photobacterium leiognathi TaxID=553611 RepID=UPI00298144F6|nr:type II toxin-antitoxin system Phd/YefM family antitoxin [Photobacterium leiognathi]
MIIETVNFLKKNADHLLLDDSLIITKGGKPSYIVSSYEEYERLEQVIAMVNMISFAESDIKQGRISSITSLKERLGARKNRR